MSLLLRHRTFASGLLSTALLAVSLAPSADAQVLSVSPSTLFFSYSPGGVMPPPRAVAVTSSGYRGLPFRATPTVGTWLKFGPATSFTPVAMLVTVDPRGLPQGAYYDNIIFASATSSRMVMVTLVIGPASFPLTAAPAALSFTAEVDSSVPQSQNLLVASTTGDVESFTASPATVSGGDWLRVAPPRGITNTFIAVTVHTPTLPIGAYSGTVTITARGRALMVPVSLTVTSGPTLVVEPNALSFTAGNGIVPPPQSVFVENANAGSVTFQVTTGGGNWFSVDPASGATFAALRVSVNLEGLDPGAYSGLIAILAEGATSPRTVQVTLTVTTQVTVEAQPSQVILTAQAGETAPVSQTLSITSNLGNVACAVSASPATWLSLSAANAVTPGSVVVSANPEGLAEGTYHASVIVTAPGAGNSPRTVPVTFTVAPAGPIVAAILHGATLKPGVLAAGTAVSIFGRSLGPETGAGLEIGPGGAVRSTLAGVRVLFDGIAGPLIYVQAWQVNAMVPYGVFGGSLVEVVVESQGVRSRPILIQLYETAPGIFTVDSSGRGPAAVLNQDLSQNSASTPAARGSVVSVFATGAGQMVPAGVDGQITGDELPAPLLAVKAWIGDREVDLSYAGGAPGMVSGILQANIRIPTDIEPGLHELVIAVGALRSQSGVTIAVN